MLSEGKSDQADRATPAKRPQALALASLDLPSLVSLHISRVAGRRRGYLSAGLRDSVEQGHALAS